MDFCHPNRVETIQGTSYMSNLIGRNCYYLPNGLKQGAGWLKQTKLTQTELLKYRKTANKISTNPMISFQQFTTFIRFFHKRQAAVFFRLLFMSFLRNFCFKLKSGGGLSFPSSPFYISFCLVCICPRQEGHFCSR